MRVAILGSCVSRDVFEFAPPKGVELAGYVARVSLATMFAKPLPLKPPEPAPSERWDRRMLRLEVTKGAAAHLLSKPFDALLVDLIDERHSLWTLGEAASVWTGEFRRAGMLEQRGKDWQRVAPGSPEHIARWRVGLSKLIARVAGRRIVLNKVLPANRYADGELAALRRPAEVAVLNDVLPALYRIFERETGCDVIEYPLGSFVLPRKHKWGLAPYHYDQSVYEHASKELARLLGYSEPKADSIQADVLPL